VLVLSHRLRGDAGEARETTVMLQMCRELGFSVGHEPDDGDIMKVVLDLGNGAPPPAR
jgi:hypothetical protein